ncbi:hypothetical protein [Tardiphaga sp.]|uniref:hypothetical protein n=1 Tax=Tardiphaga sp. TaxID=1926292 RepID=UPI0026157BCF|nr:hypothetical protein [Tardiphaga sp.]MDB5619670.1 hypothetical protein [Tardiphaga sp.]
MSHPAFQIELVNEGEFGEIVSIIGCYNDEEFRAGVKELASDSHRRDVAYRSMAPASDVKKQFLR